MTPPDKLAYDLSRSSALRKKSTPHRFAGAEETVRQILASKLRQHIRLTRVV